MKKILIGSILFSTLALANNPKYLEVKIGTNLRSKYPSLSTLLAEETVQNSAFEIAVEFMNEVSDKVDIGVGVAYQRHDKRDDGSTFYGFRDYDVYKYTFAGYENSSLPIYLALKYKFKSETEIVPYFKLDLGYAFSVREKDQILTDTGVSSSSDQGFRATSGAYYALGFGLEYEKLTFEILYSESKSNFYNKYHPEGWDGNYKRVGASLGYKFNL